MTLRSVATTALALSTLLVQITHATPPPAGPVIIAIGSIDGLYEDFATRTAAPLENHVPGNRLGGIGSGLTWLGGDFFLGLPDRGPNAIDYNDCLASDGKDALDNTTSWINRFHTLHLSLSPSDPGSVLPVHADADARRDDAALEPHAARATAPAAAIAGSGVPALNAIDHTHYFTRPLRQLRSQRGTPPIRATPGLDPESIRVSNDRRTSTSPTNTARTSTSSTASPANGRSVFTLPDKFAVPQPEPDGDVEISGNTVGPRDQQGDGGPRDHAGRPHARRRDAEPADSGRRRREGRRHADRHDRHPEPARPANTRISSTRGRRRPSATSWPINDHQFLVDERDSKGRADAVGSKAAFKKLYRRSICGSPTTSATSAGLPAAACRTSPSTPSPSHCSSTSWPF